MTVSNIHSNTLKVSDEIDWWFQERAFDYSFKAFKGEKEVFIKSSSYVQILDSFTALIHDDVAYIQFHYFNRRTHIDLWRFLRKIDDTIKGIILDVRSNPGGSLNLDIVSYFLKPEQLVAVVEDSDGTKHKINADIAYVNQKLVVLQDEKSASMSELLSAMLQKQGRATVIGQTSFGKAAIQFVFPVAKEGAMRLVKEHLYYPDTETSWADTGVEPDIKINIDKQQKSQFIGSTSSNDSSYDFTTRLKTDRVLRKAVTLLNKG